MTMNSRTPQRCAVGSCGRVPTRIEHYETGADGTGATSAAVCSGHTGLHHYQYRLTGVEPIPGPVQPMIRAGGQHA